MQYVGNVQGTDEKNPKNHADSTKKSVLNRKGPQTVVKLGFDAKNVQKIDKIGIF